MTLRSLIGRTASTLLMLGLAACGGGGGEIASQTFTIGGTVTGLASGTQVVMNDNGGAALTVSANGAFTFAEPVAANGSYLVTISTQPTGQTCSVANFQGAGVTANVSSVSVTCSQITHTIAGAVTGLAAGQQVTLNNNGTDPVAVSADGAFTFAVPVPFNGSYAVTVGTQPTGQTCTVSNGSGSGVVADVSNVAVTCSTDTFTIAGTVTGLTAGQQVTLNNNAGDPTIVAADGSFTFATPVSFNGSYAVTVGTQPTGQTCTVSNGSGAGVVANISNVTVACSTNTYTIGVTVSGLAAGKQVTLNNNGTDPLIVLAAQNGALQTFSTPVTFNGSYAVTVGTQPVGQTCTVSNGSGAGVVANIANVTVTCSTNTYTVGVTVSGLTAGKQVTLNNNGGDPLTVLAAQNGVLRTFSTPVTFNGSYAVTVGTQPVGQTCTVSNGSGTGVAANITNVTVACSTNTYTIGVTVSGLTAGKQVTLNNNGADPLTVLAAQNGVLRTFSTPVVFGGNYAVTVGTQPVGQTCVVSNGSGTGVATNVTDVTVACTTNTYTIGVTVSGLAAGQQVTLVNNNVDPLNVLAAQNGVLQTFSAPVGFNGSYAVTVGTQPTNQTCTVANGSGSGVVANVANVTVTCRLAIAYVTNKIDGTISEYTIGTDGTFTSIGTIDTPDSTRIPNGVTVDPKGRFAYVANFGADPGGAQGNTVSQYIIGATGVLTANGTVTTELNPYSIAIDPTGSYAYVTNQGSNSVSQFTINPDGTLSALGAPVATGSKPYQITVDPTGQYVYVADLADGTTTGGVSQYTISGTGELVPMSTPFVATTAAPNTGGAIGVAVDPAGTYAYVTNLFDQTVRRYTITPGTGALVAVVETAQATGVTPYPMVISPDGKFAFWSNKSDSDMTPCAISGSGQLVCSNGNRLGTVDTLPQYAAVDPFSLHVYAVNYNGGIGGSVAQFSFDTSNGSTGALTRLTPSTAPTGNGPFAITITR
jgi:YVTN family beta-propeller protein